MQSISARKIAILTVTIIFVILSFVFLWLIKSVLFLIFLSILLATGIEPLVNKLRRGPFTRGTGILVVYSLIMVAIGIILFLTIPPILEEGNRLITNLTNKESARQSITQIESPFLRDIASQAYDSFGNIGSTFKLNSDTLSIGVTLLEVVFSFISVFVIAYYWMTERTFIKKYTFSLLPPERRPGARTLWQNIENKLGAWTRGQLLLMLFIGVLSGIGYTVMGLKYALVLAVFAAITEIIPLVGPYIGGAPAVLIALTQSPLLALIVVVYIMVLQLIEGNILVPRIMNSAVGVTPLTVIIGILIGSTLAGIAGAFLAVPIAATIQVIINTITDNNNDTDSEDINREVTPGFEYEADKTDLPNLPSLSSK